MGSSAAAVSSSVCIFRPSRLPQAAPTRQVPSKGRRRRRAVLPGGGAAAAGSSVTPSAAASRDPISRRRWRGLRQTRRSGICWPCPSRASSSRADPLTAGVRSAPFFRSPVKEQKKNEIKMEEEEEKQRSGKRLALSVNGHRARAQGAPTFGERDT